MIVKNFGSQDFKDYEYEVENGGRFVEFHFAISVIFFSYKQSSPIYLLKGTDSHMLKGLGYTLVTFLVGWWGIPWGPIYTIQCLAKNLSGGTDVTLEVMSAMEKQLNPRNQYF